MPTKCTQFIAINPRKVFTFSLQNQHVKKMGVEIIAYNLKQPLQRAKKISA